MLKLTTDKHELSHGLSATAELLVVITRQAFLYIPLTLDSAEAVIVSHQII